MIYASNTYSAVKALTAMPKRNHKMLQNTSRGKETGLGFVFQISLNGVEGLEVSVTPMPCGWREMKESHNYSTGPELRSGAHPRSVTENTRAFSRLVNH